MPIDPRTPILVGVGHFEQRVNAPQEGLEPLEMMIRAVELARDDAGSNVLVKNADAVCVIRGRWRYDDPARAVAGKIGATRAQSGITPYGGNMVQSAVNRFAGEIAAGNREIAIFTGAEHGRSQSRARKQGVELHYSPAPGEPDLQLGPEINMVHEAEIARRIVAPVTMYPIFENALRAQRGESIPAHRERISELWSRFSAVASENPHAWIRERRSAEEIRTPSESNRMIGFPYTKLMNSNDSVDQAAALILCSVDAAERAGVPRDRWVFLHAGTDAHDHPLVSNRVNLHSSPAIRIAGARALELAGTSASEIERVDLYSCFPSAVQVAAQELGLDTERPLTVTGGLTFGGGPLNNYVMHSIARMAELLREDPGTRGLITANGGFLTKHAFGVYGAEPPEEGFQYESCQKEVSALPRREAAIDHDGEATLESYTVMYDADGPATAHTACLLADGRRTWANSEDRDLAHSMTESEFCNKTVRIDGKGTFAVR